MTNCMTWNMEDPEPFLEVDVSLKVTLEVMYLHFSFFFVCSKYYSRAFLCYL